MSAGEFSQHVERSSRSGQDGKTVSTSMNIGGKLFYGIVSVGSVFLRRRKNDVIDVALAAFG